mgnify:CR=1 FL=1
MQKKQYNLNFGMFTVTIETADGQTITAKGSATIGTDNVLNFYADDGLKLEEIKSVKIESANFKT